MADVVFKRIASDAAGFALYAADAGGGGAAVQASFLLLSGGAGQPPEA